jgi:potassium channel subfamily K
MIGVNATQLAIALLSNLFIYLNMARRVRFSIAQAIAVIGWHVQAYVWIRTLRLT